MYDQPCRSLSLGWRSRQYLQRFAQVMMGLFLMPMGSELRAEPADLGSLVWRTPPHHSQGLYPTLWPSDHGNTARQKFVVSGGLPPQIDPEQIQTHQNPDLSYPVLLYTRDPEELFVYGMPPQAGEGSHYIAKVDAQTLEIQQKVNLPYIPYIGGGLVHANGDFYLVHGTTLTRFTQGDLEVSKTLELPQVNGILTQHNGMLVAEDGNLILKGWAFTARDPIPMFRRVPFLLGIVGLLIGVGGVILTRRLFRVRNRWLEGGILLLTPIVCVFGVLGSMGIWLPRFLFPDRQGHLLVIDPDSLEILHQSDPPERVPFARMAMAPLANSDTSDLQEWLVIPGDEHVMRWRYTDEQLIYDPSWTEPYRQWGDGSFPGTGPSIYQNQVFYTDNTAPLGLSPGYRLYRKSLLSQAPQLQVEIDTGEAGFMFWSTVISPATQSVIVWDSHGGMVESRSLTDLSLQWQTPLLNVDCITLAADRHHIYAVDYSQDLSLGAINRSISPFPGRWQHLEKWFVVLDAETGEELLRQTLGQTSPTLSMIVPGLHDDVFVATRTGLIRVYQDSSH